MPHTARIQVEDADIDELGHASNLCYVRWVLTAALSHSAAVGLTTQDYRARGHAFIVRRHELDYLLPAFAGDVLEAITWVAEMRNASSQRATVIRRQSDGAVLLRAASRWAFVDLASGRPIRIPEELQTLFAAEAAPTL